MTSLLAIAVSTMSFSIGIEFTSTPGLPPHKAILGSPFCGLVCLLAFLWGAYRLFKPKVLISYDEESIFIPKHGQIPWTKIKSLEATKIGVAFRQGTNAGNVINDAIAIHFDDSCNFPHQGIHGSHAYFSSARCYKFSCAVSYDSRDTILSEMNEILFKSLEKG